MRHIAILLLTGFLLLMSEPSFVWQHEPASEHGLSDTAIQRLHEQLEESQVVAAVIARHGVIIDEYYKPGYSAESLISLNSCSKNITGALVGIAVEQGKIPDVNVQAGDYIPELAGSGINLWHLLTHTSGLTSTDSELWYSWRSSDNWLAYLLEQEMAAVPGRQFSYSTGNTHILSVIVERATGQGLGEFADENLFKPFGMSSARLDVDPQGVGDGGNGFSMNIYDMAKFGQLYLQNGEWNGRQIVPAEWVRDSTAVQYERSSGSADYGYQWWVRTFGTEHYPAYFAQGHGGQYIFVVPNLELVIAMASDNAGSSGIYWQMVNDVVNNCR